MARQKAATPQPQSADADVMARLALLNQRAQMGDAAAVDEIGRLLDAHPQLWREHGDLGRQLRTGWLLLAAANDPVRIEYVRRQVEDMERSLTDPSAGPAGRLLAARVATAFLVVQVLDAEAIAAATKRTLWGYETQWHGKQPPSDCSSRR